MLSLPTRFYASQSQDPCFCLCVLCSLPSIQEILNRFIKSTTVYVVLYSSLGKLFKVTICGSGRKTRVLRLDTQLLIQELLIKKVHCQA